MNAATLPKGACGISPRDEDARMPLPSPEIILLRQKQVRSLDLAENQHVRIEVSGGTAWVTMEGNADDFILTSATPGAFTGPGRLVIEAIGPEVIARLAAG